MAWQPKSSQWFVIAVAFVLAFVVVANASPGRRVERSATWHKSLPPARSLVNDFRSA